MIFIGKVTDISTMADDYRINVFIPPYDNVDGKSKPAVPLMPNFIHVRPKEGEACYIFCSDDEPTKQRFYLGPVVSQPQRLYKSLFNGGATSSFNSDDFPLSPKLSLNKNARGAFPKDDEIAIVGRKLGDMIISDNDLRIRCGCRLVKGTETTGSEIDYNRKDPAFIKLKYHEEPLRDKYGTKSTATIVAQQINLLSPDGDPGDLNLTDTDESISDADMEEIIRKAHVLPYGDKLVDLLKSFFNAFQHHTHKYSQMEPVEDITMGELRSAMDNIPSILSKNVRIN